MVEIFIGYFIVLVSFSRVRELLLGISNNDCEALFSLSWSNHDYVRCGRVDGAVRAIKDVIVLLPDLIELP